MSAYEGGQNHLPDIPAERWRAMYMEAAAELERLRADLARARESALHLKNALWKSCGDDRKTARSYIVSQGGDPKAIDAAIAAQGAGHE